MTLEQIKRALKAEIDVFWMTGLYSVHMHDDGDLYAITNTGKMCWLSGINTERKPSFLQGFDEEMFFMDKAETGTTLWEKQVEILSGFTLENTGGNIMCFCFFDGTFEETHRQILFGWVNGGIGFSACEDDDCILSDNTRGKTPAQEAEYIQQIMRFFPHFKQ